MIIDDFLTILDIKFNEPYTKSLCNSIVKIYNNNNLSYSFEDIKQDIIIYFLCENRLDKIKNKNGARKSIENQLKNMYVAKRGNKKSAYYYDNFEFMDIKHKQKLINMGFTTCDLRLHSFFYYNMYSKNMQITHLLCKNNSIDIIKKIEYLVYLLDKIIDINNNEQLSGIKKYLSERKSEYLSQEFILISRKRKYINYKKISQYLKNLYIMEVDKLLK